MKRSSTLSVALLVVLLVVLAWSHIQPQWAYPRIAFSITASLAIIGCLSFMLWLTQKQRRKLDFPIAHVVVYLSFLVFSLIVTLRSVYPAAGFYKYTTFIQGTLVFLALFFLGRLVMENGDAEKGKSLVLSILSFFFVTVSVALAAYGIYQYLWGFEKSLKILSSLRPDAIGEMTGGVIHALKYKRITATFGNPNLLCALFAISVPFIVVDLIVCKKLLAKIGLSVCVAVVIFAAYLTASRAGLASVAIALVATSICIGGKRIARQKKTIAIFAAALLLTVIGFKLLSGGKTDSSEQAISVKFTDRLKAVSTIKQRVYYLQTGLKITKQAPLIGNGLGAYALYYSKQMMPHAQESRYAHNFVVETLSETGAIGTALFILAVTLWFGYGVGGIDFTKLRTDTRQLLKSAFVVSALVFLINSLAEFSFYFRELFLDFSLLLGAMWLCSKNTTGTENSLSRKWRFFVLAALVVFSSATIIKTGAIASIAKMNYVQANEFVKSYRDTRDANELDIAYSKYRTAIRLCGDNAEYSAGFANLLNMLDRNEEALIYLRKAVSLNPTSASKHDQLSDMYARRGFIEEAIDLQKIAVSNYPLNARYHFNLGKLYLSDKKKNLAKQEIKTAIELDPDNQEFTALWSRSFDAP